MTKDAFRKKLTDNGYKKIWEWDDPPGEFFKEHDHPGDHYQYIFKGSMVVHMDDQDYNLKAGEEFIYPKGHKHSVTIGPDGCNYIVGEN